MSYADIKRTDDNPLQKNDENENPLKDITFQPYINKNSKKIVRQKFENLENKQTYLYDNYMKELKNVDSVNTNKKHNENSQQKYKKQNENSQQKYKKGMNTKNKGHNRTVSNLNPYRLNEIEYQPEYEFLFENLKSIQR